MNNRIAQRQQLNAATHVRRQPPRRPPLTVSGPYGTIDSSAFCPTIEGDWPHDVAANTGKGFPMPQLWLTIEEAAVRLKTSVRTLQRKVSAGTIESRMESGRREVLIDVPDPATQPTMADGMSDPSAYVSQAAANAYSQVGQIPPTAGHPTANASAGTYTAPDISQALAVVT